jgi:hypothetical protein
MLFTSCSKKEEDMTPVQPGETVIYQDMAYRFSFKAPKSWVVESTPGKTTTYYSSPATETRFQKFTEGDYGARVGAGVLEKSTKEGAAEQFKQSMEGVTFKGPENATLGGQPALKIVYSSEGEDGLSGYRIFTDKDSLVTFFDAATFGEKRMKKYAPVFDLSEKSVQPAMVLKMTNGKPDSASMNAMMESMKPSETMSTYTGNGFTIQYPDNFHASPVSGGVSIMGERQDAMVRVDVSPVPAGVDLNKYVEENAKKSYKGAAASNASLGGQPAKVITTGYGKVYFVMQGQKAYRVTVAWPSSLESSFRPGLEKSVQTFKLK